MAVSNTFKARSLFISFFAGLVAGWGVICLLVVTSSLQKSALALDPKSQPALVFGETVQPRELFDLLTYPGQVVPKVNTRILAEDDGIVSRILVPLGQSVRRGQRILELAHTDPVYHYAPMIVRSPIGGVVSEMPVTEGTQVTKGQALLSVTNPSQLRVTMEVPASDLSSLKKGQKAELQLPGKRGFVRLRIQGLSPFVDPATGTATCQLDPVPGVLEGGVTLVPGLIGRVSLRTNPRRGISIPEYALVYRDDRVLVRTLVNGRARLIPVKTGKRQKGSVEILSGLRPHAFLIERASRHVSDNEVVKLQRQEAAGVAGAEAGKE